MMKMMKIPKPILLYLLALEMLPILDEMNATNSIKKAVRTIEGFAQHSFNEIEKHKELALVVNDEMVQQLSRLLDELKFNKSVLLYCLTSYIQVEVKKLNPNRSFEKAIYTILDFAFDKLIVLEPQENLHYSIHKFNGLIDNIEIQELKK